MDQEIKDRLAADSTKLAKCCTVKPELAHPSKSLLSVTCSECGKLAESNQNSNALISSWNELIFAAELIFYANELIAGDPVKGS